MEWTDDIALVLHLLREQEGTVLSARATHDNWQLRIHVPERERLTDLLDMLAEEEMTIEEITDELARRGDEKATTTVRHHVNVLKDAGMVELSRLEDAGGGTQKFYRSNTRVFSYDLPEHADETLSDAEQSFREGLASLIAEVYSDHGDGIAAAATEMKPCDYCETQHYEAFILRELMNRALTDLSEDDDLDTLLRWVSIQESGFYGVVSARRQLVPVN